MKFVCGGIESMVYALGDAGDACVSHRHARPHRTMCVSGEVEIELLKVAPEGSVPDMISVDENGQTYWLYVESSKVLMCGALDNFYEVAAGRWHRIKARQDNSRYQCDWIYLDPQTLQPCAYVSGHPGYAAPMTIEPQ